MLTTEQRRRLQHIVEAKPSPEAVLREKLASRELDSKSTAEIATAVGCSEAVALRILRKLEDEGFTSNEGGTLMHNETNAGQSRFKGSRDDTRPAKYHWFFQ